MQRHDRHFFPGLFAFIVHDEADMFEEPLQVLKLLKRFHEFLEVFQPPRRLGRFVVLPHAGVAAFIEDHLGKLHVAHGRIARHATPATQTIKKQTKLCRALAAQAFFFEQDRRTLDQRDAVLARGDLDFLLGLVAQTALGCVHDPLKGQIIRRAYDQPEIGHGIADLHALIKTRAADHAVGQSDGEKAIFKGAHLVAGAHEDRHVIERIGIPAARAALHGFDLFADPAGLFLAVPMADEADLFALFGIGPKLFSKTSLVARDHARCGRQNMGRGAIVLFQTDHGGARKILFKPQDVAHFGPAPAIDRLVIVAHAADVLVPAREKPQPHVLGDVGVLIFVHQNVAKPALILGQHVVMGLENRDHVQEQIAEIDGVQFLHALLILRVERLTLAIIGSGLGGRYVLRRPGAVFPIVDNAHQHACRPAFVIDVGGLHQLFEKAQLIVGVENGEV